MTMRNADGSEHLLVHHEDAADRDPTEIAHVTLHLVEQILTLVRDMRAELTAVSADVALVRARLGVEEIARR